MLIRKASKRTILAGAILIFSLILFFVLAVRFLEYKSIHQFESDLKDLEDSELREYNGEIFYLKGTITEVHDELYIKYPYSFDIDNERFDIRSDEVIGTVGEMVYLKLQYHIEGYCGIDVYWEVLEVKRTIEISWPIISTIFLIIIGGELTNILFRKLESNSDRF